MNTKTTLLIAGLSVLSCIAFAGPLRAQTLPFTPEQTAELDRIQRLQEQKLADEQRLAQAQIRSSQLQAEAQRQAMKLIQEEAARAKISSNFAIGDAMMSAAQSGWEKAAPEVERKARDARIQMATSALDNWTPPASYRQTSPKDVALKNPFAPASPVVENVPVKTATPVTLASALNGTCLVVDEELQMVRVGESCGEAGFDGRLAAGTYPLLPGGDIVNTPERAREFLTLAAQPNGILWAYSPATKQVVRTSPKGAKS